MSLVPYVNNVRDLDRPFLYDHDFELGLWRDPFFNRLSALPWRPFYRRPWYSKTIYEDLSGEPHISYDEKGWKVSLDVQQFRPRELNVKVVGNYIYIEGKQVEGSVEDGYVSRQFSHRYQLPDDVDKRAVYSSLSSDGVLQLSAPKQGTEPRAVPIYRTYLPALKFPEPKRVTFS